MSRDASKLLLLATLVSSLAGCDRGPCDAAALERLVATPDPPVVGWEEQGERDLAERRRVSAGVRGACAGMSDSLSASMVELYETEVRTADQRMEVLNARAREQWSPSAFLRQRDRAALMERACPGWSEIIEQTASAAPNDRARVVWDRCKWGAAELYPAAGPGVPLTSGSRGLGHWFDFAVFFYLRDHGVAAPLAATVVRRLGFTEPTDQPPLHMPGEQP